MRTDILGHPPSLCTCRRVWHPAIPTLPSRGCSGLHCTNQARTAPTKLLLHPPTARDFCVFCVFRGTILRNLNICVHLCHLWEDYLGLPHPPRGCSCLSCTNRAATASSHRIHRTHRSLLLKCTPTEFTEFSCRGEFLCILRVPWDNTTQPKHLCASVPSVGGLLSGWRGYGRDAIPS